jgi:ubiquitin carboxyl-terminal hydrolase 8
MDGICGLANLGNTCYINATLQILAQIPELNDYLMRQTLPSGSDTILVVEWRQLVQMIRSNHCSIIPGRFVEQMRQVAIQKGRHEFASPHQNDSVDYLDFMLDCIHVSLDRVSMTSGCKEVNEYLDKQRLTIVSQLFMTCTLNRYLHPVTKLREFYKIEHEYRIGLPIPDLPKVTLQECLTQCFKSERMEGENAWYDEKEKKKKPVYKLSALCHTPPILVLHLIRWRENLTKKETLVESPLELDLTPFTIYRESSKYALFGILNHQGNMGGGHYYAYVKKDQWFSIDDGFVQSMSESSLIHPDNYCLFYRKL